MATLVCPKCQGEMNSYERSGITVDQCGECRGIFLDRGELERLVDAEAQYGAPAAPAAPAPPAYNQGPPPAQQGYPPQGYPQQQRGDFWDGLFGGGHHGQRRGHH